MTTRSQYIDEAIKRPVRDHSTYATDGRCHNANPGTYGHECGRARTWIGIQPSGFRQGFCDRCKADGYEARTVTQWLAA